MKQASVIIRFSNRSKLRARNLDLLLCHLGKYQDKLEVVMSVMEIDIPTTSWVVKKFTPTPFESSKANNIGASMATTDIFIFQDADIIFNLSCYDRMIEQLRSHESVRVGEKCVNLGEVTFKGLSANPDAVLRAKFTSCMRDAPGACIGLTRSAFVRIGGYCELFKVYGWEDVYFRYKVKKLTSQTCLQEQMLHMPHEQNYQIGKQPVNAPLYHELLNIDGGDCVKLSKRDRDALLSTYPTLKARA